MSCTAGRVNSPKAAQAAAMAVAAKTDALILFMVNLMILQIYFFTLGKDMVFQASYEYLCKFLIEAVLTKDERYP